MTSIRKKAAYEVFGVRSSWVVVPGTRRPELTAFEFTGGRHEQAARASGDEVFRAVRPFTVEVVPARLVPGLRPR